MYTFSLRTTLLRSGAILGAGKRLISHHGYASLAPNPNFHIPVINFAKFRSAKSQGEKKSTADEIVGAFKESGFIYIENHGIPTGARQASCNFVLLAI